MLGNSDALIAGSFPRTATWPPSIISFRCKSGHSVLQFRTCGVRARILHAPRYQQKKKEAGDFLISAIERQVSNSAWQECWPGGACCSPISSYPGSRHPFKNCLPEGWNPPHTCARSLAALAAGRSLLGHRRALRRFLRKPKGAYGWRVVPSVSQKAFAVARCYREWRPLRTERREISDSPSIAERAASHNRKTEPLGLLAQKVLAGSNLPGHTTPLPGLAPLAIRAVFGSIFFPDLGVFSGLHLCGDSTYPGIGVPSAAMSGHMCGTLGKLRSLG